MRIPKRFKLYGQTVDVELDPLLSSRDDVRGWAVYRESKIRLQTQGENNGFPASHIEQTFCHELVHYLFHCAGYPKDRMDETKVERVANLLHQALTTMEYE